MFQAYVRRSLPGSEIRVSESQIIRILVLVAPAIVPCEGRFGPREAESGPGIVRVPGK
jgi:hypothetical protein